MAGLTGLTGLTAIDPVTVHVDSAVEFVDVAQVGARLERIERDLRDLRRQLRTPDGEGDAIRTQIAALEAEHAAHLARLRAEHAEVSGGWGTARVAAPDHAPKRLSAVPPRFAGATFDTYLPKTPAQATALRIVRGFVQRTLAGTGPMLALIGPQGTGKSHLLYAAAHALAAAPDSDRRVYVRPWYRLADELRYGGRDPFGEAPGPLEPSAVRDVLWGQRVALVDEVRPTAGTAFDDTELTKFACHAYDQQAAVLITTNVSVLADVMGPPAASRFVQFVIDGPDHRQAAA